MNLLNFLRIIVLVTNGVYCFIPRGDYDSPSAPKTIAFPIQQQTAQTNDISVYDPGVEKQKSPSLLLPPISTGTNSHLPTDRMHNNFAMDDSDSLNLSSDTNSDGNSVDINQILDSLRTEIQSEENIAEKSAILLRLLEESPSKAPLPVLYVENDVDQMNDDDYMMNNKRSGRYYRRYPWKRQNTRSRTYEAESRYLCVPSREDVYKLLIGLHENRNGNHHKQVQFCNRKRPAKAIFTNIRFLG